MRPLLIFLCFTTSAFASPVPLFDGKSLDGWDFDAAMWRVEGGVITGGSRTEKIKKNDFISTKKSYQNFELKLKIKVSGDPQTGMLNSGIQIRSVRAGGGAMSGYQVDCGAGWFGKIYDEHRRNKVIWAPPPEQQAALDKVVDVFGWNEYRIRAEGPRIQTWINGVLCIDYTETDPNIALDGHIAPQVHSGGVCLVEVKDITIEELPATPGAPTWEKVGHPKPKQAAKFQNVPGQKRDTSYNDIQGTSKTAAEQQKLFHLPEGYEIELVVQESEGLGKFVSVYFDQRGRLWTQTALEYPIDANENPAAAEAVYASKGKDKVLVYPRESLNAKIPAGGLTNPTVYADGLAIPLGILPWGNGDTCYVQHGHDLKLYKDTNGDGKADTFEVILTGFGVQDSHLFPHQFTRAPGGWIWMAQGLFNNSKVHKPGSDVVVDYPKCGMARMRPDGSEFEMTSTGPNNIWGLVITGQGETFIQEANDYGYPVMPFHEYAYYPGGMEALKKSYQPDFPPQAEFRMGGTGLSGLALMQEEPDHLVMAVANPITSKVQQIDMKREPSGPRAPSGWHLEQLLDLVTCDDPFFRPVAMTNGPDGCIYIVDWYNKIISHNEVPRNHPDRDKVRGRIWRVKPKKTLEIPDYTKLSEEELVGMLGTLPSARAHLAWQTLADSSQAADPINLHLERVTADSGKSLPSRIQALWAITSFSSMPPMNLFWTKDHSAIREALRISGDTAAKMELKLHADLKSSPHENVRSVHLADGPVLFADQNVGLTALVKSQSIIELAKQVPFHADEVIPKLLSFAKPSLPGQTIASTRGGGQIPVGPAYEREFERFLVRMFLERHPDITAKFLDGEEAANLPTEALVLASLALEPKASASRVARLLPKLDREPNDEELLRLAEFPEEPGCGDALKSLLLKPATLEKLLSHKTKLDPAKIAPLLTDAVKAHLDSPLGVQLVAAFQLKVLEPELLQRLKTDSNKVSTLQALKELKSAAAEDFAALVKSSDSAVRIAALDALAASSSPKAPDLLLSVVKDVSPAERKTALNSLSSTLPGSKAIVAALVAKTLAPADLDATAIERMSTVLAKDESLKALESALGGVFKEVLTFDGSEEAWIDSKITLTGPFTVEAWVKLSEGITNADSILGAPQQLDLNFYDNKFRAWVGVLHDVAVSQKPLTPDLWTHVAVTRSAKGEFKLYQNGELDAVGTKTSTAVFKDLRIGWSGGKGGTAGSITEFRVWPVEKSAAEIRAQFDRTDGSDKTYTAYRKGVRSAKTIDLPPLLSAEQAKALDEQFTHLTALTKQPANLAMGKALSAICTTCHQIGNTGGQIGPNLSSAGAMGLEAVLRNILTPNAAMEPGYRIFRAELTNGDLVDAFYVSEDKDAIVVRQPGAADKRLKKADIRSTRYIRRSLMPEGLLEALNDEQKRDLLGYLMTLK
jgi:putative heme-binding domain-containing protein